MDVLEILRRLYESEIPVRLEWMFDGGFTWVLPNNYNRDRIPRLMYDNSFGEETLVDFRDKKQQINESFQILQPDWHKRGNNHDLKIALKELADATCEVYPTSEFNKWWTRLN